MKSYRTALTYLLLTALPVCLLAENTKEEKEKETKPSAEWIAEAQELLDPGTNVKGRKKALTEWLETSQAEKADLGKYAYLTAFVTAKLGDSEAAAKALLAAVRADPPAALPYHAAKHANLLNRVTHAAIQQGLSEGEVELVPPLVRTLIAHTDRAPHAVIAPIARRMKELKPEQASPLRTDLINQVTEWQFISAEAQDTLAGLLYGKRLEAAEPAPASPAPKAISGRPFANPEFLIMGGGGSPSHNQISLEKNVQFLLRVQEGKGLSGDKNHILFADGTSDGRDLQLVDEQNKPDELQELLASLLASASGIRYTYRDNELDDVQGESSEPNIKKFFEELNATNGQPVVVNFTGHGGRGDKKDVQNTCMYLWEGKTLRVKDFCSMLDEVAEDSPLMVLMVQCYSGGFANIIFEEGNPEKNLAKHLRCGFFATVHDRIAAGCTPAVNEADYREYSSYFLAALHGKDRVGRAIEKPDYDGDGKVCFAEAHAYALITSDTLDISVKTSDAFLRKFSKLGNGHLDINSYRQLLAHAGPIEQAVLEQLSETLELHGDARVQSAKSWSQYLLDQRKKAGEQRSEAKKIAEAAKKELRIALRKRWPELFYPWHPAISEIMAQESDAVRKVIDDHPKGQEYIDALKTYKKHSDTYYGHEARWAVYQRFIRTAENVAFEANLPKFAHAEILERYQQLKELECGTLQPEQSNRKAL